MQKQDSVLLKHIDANTLKEINSLVTNFKDIIFILAMFDAEKNRCDVERAEKDNLMAPDEFGDYKF